MEVANHTNTPEFMSPLEFASEAELNFNSKTSQKMQYEAHVEVIRRQIGGLEEVRMKLGLSARKVCQLLLVDPSAWSRWKKEGAPPHIWRALQWYLSLQQQIPGLTPAYFLHRDPGLAAQETTQKIKALETRMQESFGVEKLAMQNRIDQLEVAIRVNRMTAYMLGFATLLMGAALWRIMISR